MQHRNPIPFGFVITSVLAGCLGAAGQGASLATVVTPTGSPGIERSVHAGTLLANGIVLVAGGSGGFGNDACLSGAELYDPATGVSSSRHTGGLAEEK